MALNIGTIQRRLSTLIEEFKRARDTWEELNSHAFPVANTLSNSVIQSRYVDETQYWHPLLTMTCPNIIQKFDSKMQVIIEKQNENLIDLVEKMAKQYQKMQGQYKELAAIYDRAKDTHGIDFANQQAIYQTCSLNSFVNFMRSILEMYSNELETKRSCTSLKGFQSIKSREEGVVLLSVWINQPSIVKSVIEDWQDICTTEMELP